MADLYGSAPDSEEISNIISELLHGHGSSASSASSSMPFKPTYMHLLHSSVPLPLQAATQSEILTPEARHEDHVRFAQLVDRSGSDQRVVGGNSNSAGVLESSSGFYFSDSDGCFTAKVKEGMEPDGRRISSENDLGDFRCDSEKGLEEAKNHHRKSTAVKF